MAVPQGQSPVPEGCGSSTRQPSHWAGETQVKVGTAAESWTLRAEGNPRREGAPEKSLESVNKPLKSLADS